MTRLQLCRRRSAARSGPAPCHRARAEHRLGQTLGSRDLAADFPGRAL